MVRELASLDEAVAEILRHAGGRLRVAAPLGIGKPHRLLNAIYDAVADHADRSLQIYTALSLTPPSAGSDLERRFLQPFVDRHFGEDFPRLKYTLAQRADALPPHVRVEEF